MKTENSKDKKKSDKFDFDKPIKGGFVRRLILIPEKLKKSEKNKLIYGR